MLLSIFAQKPSLKISLNPITTVWVAHNPESGSERLNIHQAISRPKPPNRPHKKRHHRPRPTSSLSGLSSLSTASASSAASSSPGPRIVLDPVIETDAVPVEQQKSQSQASKPPSPPPPPLNPSWPPEELWESEEGWTDEVGGEEVGRDMDQQSRWREPRRVTNSDRAEGNGMSDKKGENSGDSKDVKRNIRSGGKEGFDDDVRSDLYPSSPPVTPRRLLPSSPPFTSSSPPSAESSSMLSPPQQSAPVRKSSLQSDPLKIYNDGLHPIPQYDDTPAATRSITQSSASSSSSPSLASSRPTSSISSSSSRPASSFRHRPTQLRPSQSQSPPQPSKPIPTHTLTGILTLTLPRSQSALHTLTLKFTGTLKIDIHALKTGQHEPSSRPPYTRTLVDTTQTVWSGGTDGLSLAQGIHPFPFEIPLGAPSSQLPDSVTIRHASVCYEITATITKVSPSGKTSTLAEITNPVMLTASDSNPPPPPPAAQKAISPPLTDDDHDSDSDDPSTWFGGRAPQSNSLSRLPQTITITTHTTPSFTLTLHSPHTSRLSAPAIKLVVAVQVPVGVVERVEVRMFEKRLYDVPVEAPQGPPTMLEQIQRPAAMWGGSSASSIRSVSSAAPSERSMSSNRSGKSKFEAAPIKKTKEFQMGVPIVHIPPAQTIISLSPPPTPPPAPTPGLPPPQTNTYYITTIPVPLVKEGATRDFRVGSEVGVEHFVRVKVRVRGEWGGVDVPIIII